MYNPNLRSALRIVIISGDYRREHFQFCNNRRAGFATVLQRLSLTPSPDQRWFLYLRPERPDAVGRMSTRIVARLLTNEAARYAATLVFVSHAPFRLVSVHDGALPQLAGKPALMALERYCALVGLAINSSSASVCRHAFESDLFRGRGFTRRSD